MLKIFWIKIQDQTIQLDQLVCSTAPNPLPWRAGTLHSMHQAQKHSFSPLLAFIKNPNKEINKRAALAKTNVKHNLSVVVFENEKLNNCYSPNHIHFFKTHCNQLIPQYLHLKSKLFSKLYLHENILWLFSSFTSMY